MRHTAQPGTKNPLLRYGASIAIWVRWRKDSAILPNQKKYIPKMEIQKQLYFNKEYLKL